MPLADAATLSHFQAHHPLLSRLVTQAWPCNTLGDTAMHCRLEDLPEKCHQKHFPVIMELLFSLPPCNHEGFTITR